jgi:hypothetical protein
MPKPFIIFTIGSLLAFNMSSQTFFNKPVFISPGLSFGYTFGAKLNYGFTLDLGLVDNSRHLNNKYGISFYQYFVHTKTHVHRLRSLSVMYQNNYVDLKIGRGRAKNPWGYTNRNKCIVHGFAMDISGAYPSVYSPWLGYRLFKFNRADWAWFMGPYHSLYIKYKYDIIQNTGLKKIITLER